MKISIISPETVKNEELKLLRKALELMQKQIRSNQRYAAKICALVNKVEECQRKYSQQI